MGAAHAVEPSGLTEWYGAVVGVGPPQRAGGRDALLVPPIGVVGTPRGLLKRAAADVILDEAGQARHFRICAGTGTAGEGL
ncbi:hypothetical protein [Streptomyces sp. NPDC055134]